MIFKRFAANLRAQNWFAITIELGIVIVGVFIGTLVANWNQQRVQDREARQLIRQAQPDLERMANNFDAMDRYFATTRRYADTALAGWQGDPSVSDRDFVIAAYQASQVFALTFDFSTWASVVDSEQIRSIKDHNLRNRLAEVIYADLTMAKPTNLYTDYRKNVRRAIPLSIQESIREKCGDQSKPNGDEAMLPPTCDIAISPQDAAAAAARLRAHPELIDDLGFHFATVAVALNVARGSSSQIRALLPELAGYAGKAVKS